MVSVSPHPRGLEGPMWEQSVPCSAGGRFNLSEQAPNRAGLSPPVRASLCV